MAKMRGVLVILAVLITLVNAQEEENLEFPPDFKFGVSTSAYQIEGAWNVDGKGENIWDWITHTNPTFVVDGSNGNDACKAYDKVTEDVQLIKDLGVDYYRFSISWSRLLPTGHANDVNQEGVDYYNSLIDALVDEGIEPVVTMFHWDLPLPMHELGGWTNPILANYFVNYAEKLIDLFGDRVKYWITFNEPFQFCNQGYSSGGLAPGYGQDGIGGYLCGHTVLLAHARTYHLYHEYEDTEKNDGNIGITLDSRWFEPEDEESPDDQKAADDSLEMMLGWFAHPIFSDTGDYPKAMTDRISQLSTSQGFSKSRLPLLTEDEVNLIQGTADFFGLNHYTSALCRPAEASDLEDVSYNNDVAAYCDQPDEWEGAASPWLKVYSEGFRKLLNYIRTNYPGYQIMITENGFSDTGELDDCKRANYFNLYLQEMLKAIDDGCQVVAYMAWSLMDNFEWSRGYTEKFGLYHVDFEDENRARTLKMSGKVYRNIIENKKIDFDYIPEGHTCSVSGYVFPANFEFGVATASYQIEGAYDEDGKGQNIWDYMTHERPELIADRSTGDIACDAYHKTDTDVAILKDLGVDFYRFSISWSRILPTGHVNKVNQLGIDYYKNLITKLKENDIKPFVTMFHWDLPQPLQEIGGWPNPLLADIFVDYARVLFANFGEDVKDWITFNEPMQICEQGYSIADKAPAYTQQGLGGYLCAHTLLIAHGKTYRMYKEEFYTAQQGRVGITIDTGFSEPETDSPEDMDAAERSMQLNYGWYAHPIFSEEGDYPEIMRQRIDELSSQEGFFESRLPVFTDEEINIIRKSSDFLGLNHYTSGICKEPDGNWNPEVPSHNRDVGSVCYQKEEWEVAASQWLRVYPEGLRKLLVWIKDEYNNPEVIITENGFSDSDGHLNDCRRINYFNSYLDQVLLAIHEDDCNIAGYTAWSLMDNFEWRMGYTERFGIYHVDFEDAERPRTPKMSSYIYRKIIETRKIDWDYTPEDFDDCVWD